MAVFYLDASAVLKRYRTEKGTDVIDALYESVKRPRELMDAIRESLAGGRKLVTSHFTCLEVESVAARTLKGKSVIDFEYSTLLGSFAQDLRDYVRLEPFGGELLNYAIEATRRTRLRPADSIQFASALHVRARDEKGEFVLVASDKELLKAAEGAGIKTLDPEAEGAMEALGKMT
jgi:predicted nucleic acid-binding protein